MSTVSITRRSEALGKVASNTETITPGGYVVRETTIPAAKAGTLSVRTNTTAGTLNMAAGHGFTTGCLLMIFWATGQRWLATAGTVSGNTVPFTNVTGGGDDLPIQGTAITAMVPVVEAFDISDVTTLLALICSCLSAASFIFRDSENNVLKYVKLLGNESGANPTILDGYSWSPTGPELDGDNPLGSGDCATVYLAQGGAVAREVSAIAAIS